MSRIAVGIEYHGAAFSGWQALPGRLTVQSELERALSAVAAHAVTVTAAGRTDAGVHAVQQIAHFDSDAPRSPHAWLLGTNAQLTPDLALRWVRAVDTRFHARHSALRRHYRYLIHNHRARSALVHARAGWWPQPLDATAMHVAAQALLGEHDFSSFRDSQCQSPTPMRRLDAIHVRRHGEFVVVDVTGNAFLHHMVRNIVGTLVVVGLGKQPPCWVAEVLAARDRNAAGMTAPAAGLYFVGPEYPAEFALPAPPAFVFPPV
ncbi:tRNA pseudouridine(38-40) synthase TruA [Sinimarinibacterium thermocellulolyticum]|uniref:tRNA pseudouridine synthase A n=1 Tax=Sinimarinibacterium thermocellulolyticum TaxID=3170016 RepID=A0ABV2AB23_9GAMM